MGSGWATRRRNETLRAKERGEEISEREAHLRAGASLHRPSLKLWLWDRGDFPNPRLYDGIEVKLSQWSVTLPNCVALEPEAVRAKRDYDKMTGQVARMIEEGRAQPEEIRFVCSEFFVFVRNGEHFLVRWGERTNPYRIDKDKVEISFETRTVTFGNNSNIRNVT